MEDDPALIICGGPGTALEVLFANARFAESVGGAFDQIAGRPLFDVLPGMPNDQQRDLLAALSLPHPIFQHIDLGDAAAMPERYELAAWPAPNDTPAIWVIRLSAQGLNAGPPPIDLDFVNQLSVGLVLFDASDRLTWFNGTYHRVLGPNAHLLRVGDRFEDIMSAAYRSGHAAATGGDLDARIAERLARHRNHESFEEALSGGRWLFTQEIETTDGGTLGVRTDITNIKRAHSTR